MSSLPSCSYYKPAKSICQHFLVFFLTFLDFYIKQKKSATEVTLVIILICPTYWDFSVIRIIFFADYDDWTNKQGNTKGEKHASNYCIQLIGKESNHSAACRTTNHMKCLFHSIVPPNSFLSNLLYHTIISFSTKVRRQGFLFLTAVCVMPIVPLWAVPSRQRFLHSSA